MKKFLLLATVLFIGATSHAQSYSEDFEGFSQFDKVAANSEHWRTWGDEYRAAADGVVSTAFAHSGNNSMYLYSKSASGGPMDIVLDFGGAKSSGILEVSWWIRVQEGTGAYFNLQGTTQDGEMTLANCYLYGDSIYFEDGQKQYQAPLYTDTWQKFEMKADLTLNQWTLFIDQAEVANFSLPIDRNRLAGIDFYPINEGEGEKSAFWIDDVSYKFEPYDFPSTNIQMLKGGRTGDRLVGNEAFITAQMKNESNLTLTEVELGYNYSGKKHSETHTGLSITPGEVFTLTSQKPFVLTEGADEASIKILSFNSGTTDDNPSDNEIIADMEIIAPVPGKRVLVEEGTGTWCGWCPRGAITLDRFHDEYAAHSVGVAVHYGDPMEVQFYTNEMNENHFDGYPSGKVNRTHLSGMGFEQTQELFFEEIAKAPSATFEIAAQQNNNQLSISIDYSFLQDVGTDWKVGCLLMEDGVTGTSSQYDQSNFYSGGAQGPMGGYEELPSRIPAKDMVYNHVARAIAPNVYGADVFQQNFSNGDDFKATFTFNLSSNWNTDELHIVPILYRADGTIDNVGLSSLKEALDNSFSEGEIVAGVHSFSSESWTLYPNPTRASATLEFDQVEPRTVHVYDQQGQLVYATQSSKTQVQIDLTDQTKGLYIIRVQTPTEIMDKKLIVE